MIGTSFFRADPDKCPRCGSFGIEDTEIDIDTVVCPTCSTRFNEYVILQEGQEIEFENH